MTLLFIAHFVVRDECLVYAFLRVQLVEHEHTQTHIDTFVESLMATATTMTMTMTMKAAAPNFDTTRTAKVLENKHTHSQT